MKILETINVVFGWLCVFGLLVVMIVLVEHIFLRELFWRSLTGLGATTLIGNLIAHFNIRKWRREVYRNFGRGASGCESGDISH
jgi:hypothetical protein